MKDERWDELFDKAFEESVHHIELVPIPDHSKSWNKIKGKLQKQKSRSLPTKFRYVLPVAVASFILGAFLFSSPTVSKAFTPFFDTIKDIKDNVVVFVFGSNDHVSTTAKTPPPDEHAGIEDGANGQELYTIDKSYETWEEALQHVNFSPIQFNYIPMEYKPLEFRLFMPSGEDLSNDVRLVYENEAREMLLIKVRKLDNKEVSSSSHVKGDGDYEIIKVKDMNGYFFDTNHGQRSIEFLMGSLQIGIYGELTKEEMMKIAENIN